MWKDMNVKEKERYFHVARRLEEEHRKKYPGK
jgi:hypothetical protein